MGKSLNVVTVSGGLQNPSRTSALVHALATQLAKHRPVHIHAIEVGEIASELGQVVNPARAPAAIEHAIKTITQADFLIVGTPVYRGSYTGLFKHLFDLVHYEALINTPVLLSATGGSDRHTLMIDHQLRPLFAFFQANTLPVGVYGVEGEFENYQVNSVTLQNRIELAIQRALPVLDQLHPTNKALAA